ncbi:Serine/threonine-protein kinase PAK mbt [Diplonema papillatum]|nr:Serine/threonine-protein kinase PAK mbt [Diplonema papillatum]
MKGAPGVEIQDAAGRPQLRLQCPLGQGAFGEAWRATKLRGYARQDVAVKWSLQPSDSNLINEARTLLQLNHPNIQLCLTVFEGYSGRFFLVLAFANRGDLRSIMKPSMDWREYRAAPVEDLGIPLLYLAGGWCADVAQTISVVQDALVQLPGEVWALLAKHSKAVEDFVSTPSVATAQHLLVALHAVVPEVVRGVGFQSEEEICSLAEQCLRGLAHAHEHGVCHGDMKPENILCTKSGRLWIADFGSAVTNLEESTVSPASSVTDRDERHANLTHGTMPYLPPEVDDGLLGAPADVWAVGMVMHEMCLMRHPYIPNGAARSQLAARQYARVVDCQGLYSLARLRDLGLLPHRSRQLCCFVDSFLCRDPAKRPTAAELLDHPVFAAGKKLKPAGGSAARAKPAPLNPAGKPAKSGRASLG